MLLDIFIGSTLIVITTIVHAWGMSTALKWLRIKSAQRQDMASFETRSLVVAVFVLILFVATLIEIGVWATAYLALGAISEIEKALYFSMVTYTTLGYGDIVMEDRWRLLSSFESANGIIMFGWSTALIVAAINNVSVQWKRLYPSD